MRYKDITIKTEAEVKQLLVELREKAHDLSVKHRLNQLKNTKELPVIRKDIAKILTYLHLKTVK